MSDKVSHNTRADLAPEREEMTATSTPEQLEQVKNRAKSVGDMFYSRVRETGHREAFRFPDANEDWHSVTWAQAGVISG